MLNPKKKKSRLQPDDSGRYAGIATKMFSTILAGMVLGMLLDWAFGTPKPYLTAFFTVSAVFFALYATIREFL